MEAALGAPFELPSGWPFASAERGSQSGSLGAGSSLEAPAPTQRHGLFAPFSGKRARGETGRTQPRGAAHGRCSGKTDLQGAMERLLDAHGEQSNRTSAVPIGASKPPNRPVFFWVEKWTKNGTEHCRTGRTLGGRRLRERRVRGTARQFTGARLPGVPSADAAAGLQRVFWP